MSRGYALAEADHDRERSQRLSQLDQRLERHRQTYAAPSRKTTNTVSQASMAWQMVIELISGLLIGFGIGYGLDLLFGTSPIFLMLFVLLGFAAGVNVMLRTAREVARKGAEAEAEAEEKEKG